MSRMSSEERKRQDERHQRILKKMLNEEPNKFCADCGAKGEGRRAPALRCFGPIAIRAISSLTRPSSPSDRVLTLFSPIAGPRWASWNLGSFLCIRCAGIHRNLGVHVSRVKSTTLDSWTPEQIETFQEKGGNDKVNAYYEANLPSHFRRPTSD